MNRFHLPRMAVTLVLLITVGCASETPGEPSETEFPAEGPYSVTREDAADFVYFFPQNLNAESDWPALVWFNGQSGYTDDFNYNELLESVASWGFVVIGGKSSGMNPAESDQRTELLRRNGDADDVLFDRVDEDRIGLAGHSLGGFQTTEVSSEYRVTVAIQGAGFPPASGASPTLFMTSEGDTVVSPSVLISAFERAVNDAWLAIDATADHNDPRTDGGVFREPVVAFLRWQLHDDADGGMWFGDNGCVLCEDPSWSFESR